MPAKKPKLDEKPQRERFIEAAREVEADETEKGAEKAFEMILSDGAHASNQHKRHKPQIGSKETSGKRQK